ncbi:phosphatidylinositide phosphatase SAC1-like [Photinus pyralis]|uniref:phosphatidylinositide phosphatase SAC1-like n=1 Tax=Photinus pyralis TaxID=7054 RepID=UPI0012673A24|nr:phosphatidylinositide phosphatase SAC1-like [Photinus pyralis]
MMKIVGRPKKGKDRVQAELLQYALEWLIKDLHESIDIHDQEDSRRTLEDKNQIWLLAIDLAKAFDQVKHEALTNNEEGGTEGTKDTDGKQQPHKKADKGITRRKDNHQETEDEAAKILEEQRPYLGTHILQVARNGKLAVPKLLRNFAIFDNDVVLRCFEHVLYHCYLHYRPFIVISWNRYKPPPHLVDVAADEQQSACARHLDSLSVYYGRQVLLDLVDQRGSEGKLQKAYADTVQALGFPFVRYEPFDFHSECRHMRWDRLSILLDRISLEQDDMGFFLLLRDGSIPLLQDGVFRTNCVDCLDRTNVVQSMIARRCLGNILHKLSIIKSEESIEEFPSLERVFKEVWADNADLISLQYSGTGALKTDFTRTGKRTHVGLMRDGLNSLTRYYKNNFSDGFRQDAIDLFHGIAEIKSPLRIERGWKYITFPSVLLVAIAMFVACAILPSEYSTDSLLFILFWGVMVTATLTTILNHGPEFVDQPRLTVL